METFSKPREMVEDDRFSEKRIRALKQLNMSEIGPPIRDIISTDSTWIARKGGNGSRREPCFSKN